MFEKLKEKFGFGKQHIDVQVSLAPDPYTFYEGVYDQPTSCQHCGIGIDPGQATIHFSFLHRWADARTKPPLCSMACAEERAKLELDNIV